MEENPEAIAMLSTMVHFSFQSQCPESNALNLYKLKRERKGRIRADSVAEVYPKRKWSMEHKLANGRYNIPEAAWRTKNNRTIDGRKCPHKAKGTSDYISISTSCLSPHTQHKKGKDQRSYQLPIYNAFASENGYVSGAQNFSNHLKSLLLFLCVCFGLFRII